MSAQVQISQLPAAGTITGDELVPIVQNGQTVKTTTGAIAASPSQTQTFLTFNQEPTLPNSRYFAVGAGLTLTDGGAQSFYRISYSGIYASLGAVSTGILVNTDGANIAARSVEASGAGLQVANGDGIAGNPTVSLSGTAASLANNSGTGFLALPGNNTVSGRTLNGTANQIEVTNGDGVAGSPVFSLANNPILPGAEGVTVPNGATAERPALPNAGLVRYNTTTSRLEGYTTIWQSLGSGDGTVTAVSGVSDEISVQNSTTTPIIGLADNPVLPGNASVKIPAGTTAQRPASPINGELRYNAQIELFEGYAGGVWDQFTTGGSGVVSVGLALPSEFTVSGSPVTSSGDLTGAWASQTANYFFAAPNGLSGTPGFRAMVAADVPTLNQNTTGTAAAIAGGAPNKVLYQSNTGVTSFIDAPSSGSTYLQWTGSAFQWVSITGTLAYQGGWDASTNTPTLTSSVGTNGYYYVVTTAGTTNLNGITDWQVGDWAIFNGSIWQKIDQTNTVSSVNGYTGAVTLSYTDVGAPSTSGTNATGTWAIDISGNAATATSATTATNVAGGAANKIVYNTGAGVTSFIDAPVTAGHYLKWNGSAFEWNVAGTGTVTSVDVSGGTTGLTTSGGPVTTSGTITLAGTLATTNGGTGLTTFTAGDLPYYATGTALSKLGIGTSAYLLTSSGTAPQWTNPTSVTVGAATNATNTANVAISTSTTNANFYLPLVSTTTGNLPEFVATGLTANPSTGKITGGIAGGTF